MNSMYIRFSTILNDKAMYLVTTKSDGGDRFHPITLQKNWTLDILNAILILDTGHTVSTSTYSGVLRVTRSLPESILVHTPFIVHWYLYEKNKYIRSTPVSTRDTYSIQVCT